MGLGDLRGGFESSWAIKLGWKGVMENARRDLLVWSLFQAVHHSSNLSKSCANIISIQH